MAIRSKIDWRIELEKPQPANPTPALSRLIALVLAGLMGLLLASFAREAWAYYWISKDTREGTAVILQKSAWGHGAFDYRYSVDGKTCLGTGGTDVHDPRYRRGNEFIRQVQPGDTAPVHYSASHPWLSTLRPVSEIFPPLPLLLIGLFFEVIAVITLINPQSNWAIGSRKQNS